MKILRTISGQLIRPLFSNKEVRFLIMDQAGYICTLVPSQDGFVLSQLDIELGLEVDPEFVQSIERTIEEHYA